jgi:hypothetical protein
MNGVDALLSLQPAVLVALCALAVLQIALDVVSFVDLYKRPVERLTFANKWVWVAIILLVNTIGAVVYLAVGRRSGPAADVRPQSPAATRAADAADLLYGKRKDAGKP